MDTSSILTRLTRALKPTLFGDADQTATDARLADYVAEGEAKASGISPETKALEAVEAWARYQAYSDAADFALSQAEQVDVDSEGGVNMGDMAKRVAALKKSASDWKANFDALSATPTLPRIQRGSTQTDVEASF